MPRLKTQRRGAQSGAQILKKSLPSENKPIGPIPPPYDSTLPEYTEKQHLLLPKHPAAEQDVKQAIKIFDLAIRVKNLSDTSSEAIAQLSSGRNDNKLHSLDLAIRPKPSGLIERRAQVTATRYQKDTKQHYDAYPVPKVCTKDPVCTCGGVFSYVTDHSEAMERFLQGRPGTYEERRAELGRVNRLCGIEWRDWSNAHEEVSEDES